MAYRFDTPIHASAGFPAIHGESLGGRQTYRNDLFKHPEVGEHKSKGGKLNLPPP
jgi:hypothetical protein